MFIVTSRAVGDVEPFEHYKGDEGLTLGMAVKLTAGVLKKATGTTRPTHILMGGKTAGGLYPCIRTLGTTCFAAKQSVAVPTTAVGSAVTLAEDGLGVTATTTNGVFTVTATDNTKDSVCMGYFA